MLVVIVILTMLAGIVMFAIRGAQESARQSKTKATIQKLHNIVAAIYGSYDTRRVPITIPPGTNLRDAAIMRLGAIRDIMRMEMPDRWTDVVKNPLNPNFDPSDPGWWPNLVLPSPPTSLTTRYFSRYRGAWLQMQARPGLTAQEKQELIERWGAAECLYLIVSSDPDAIAQFSSDEVGDIDGDGLPEFHDGWGRPIRFLRWPAGFLPANGADTDLQSGDAVNDHDQFDPGRVAGGYRLYPLIYSAGRDGEFDVNIGKDKAATDRYPLGGGLVLDPFAFDKNGHQVALPINDDTGLAADLRHYDNIHNHRVETP